jgi:hypothetical protein
MLANLDNEVNFKQVFTDVEVFCAFVKDVLNISIEIDKVETGKVLSEPVSAIKFRMDLFAQSKDKRVIVEIQKVDYDYSYDRFSHYFLGNMVAMQRDSIDYSYAKDVYIIVVVTSAYRISELNGKPIKDDVLITDINPRNLKGEIRFMNNHKMVILNTTYLNADTPDGILDWMNLIAQSIKNPENPQINLHKPAIVKAAKLANKDNLSAEQLADGKIEEMKKITAAIMVDEGRKDKNNKRILQALKQGKLSKQDISELFEVTLAYIESLENN